MISKLKFSRILGLGFSKTKKFWNYISWSESRSMLAWEALCGTKRIGWERRGGHTLGFLESMFGMWSLGEKCRQWSVLSELLARSESSRCRREFPMSSNRKLVLCIMSEKKFWCLAYYLEKWKVEGGKKGKRKKKMKILLSGALISLFMLIFSLFFEQNGTFKKWVELWFTKYNA